MKAEAAERADFSRIRYAQVWEDADVLLDALKPGPEDVCVSIASAGDNALALLSKGCRKVVALDLNPAQLACLELRAAAYRRLEHAELLALIGTRSDFCGPRQALYQRCRADLGEDARKFWDAHPEEIDRGIGHAGKFERYFRIFRRVLMTCIHGEKTIRDLLAGGSIETRRRFYEERWNTWRWRALFQVFFSRKLMGLLGRDPSFFRYVEGSVAERILSRTRHALTELDPAANPYLQWILCEKHTTALPWALRPENFGAIRQNLARLEWRLGSIEEFLESEPGLCVTKWNLSDIFEYMSEESTARLLERICDASSAGARVAYWNMLAPRSRPESLAHRLRPHREEAESLLARDKAFFYSAFVLEEVIR